MKMFVFSGNFSGYRERIIRMPRWAVLLLILLVLVLIPLMLALMIGGVVLSIAMTLVKAIFRPVLRLIGIGPKRIPVQESEKEQHTPKTIYFDEQGRRIL